MLPTASGISHVRRRCLEAQIVEVLDGVGRQRPLGEIAAVFAERQRQRHDQRFRTLLERLAGDELFRTLAERGQQHDGRVLVITEILPPQRRDHGRYRRFELGEVALAQIAMPGRTDDQGQAIGLPGKRDRPLARRRCRQRGCGGHRDDVAGAHLPCKGRLFAGSLWNPAMRPAPAPARFQRPAPAAPRAPMAVSRRPEVAIFRSPVRSAETAVPRPRFRWGRLPRSRSRLA